MKVRALVGWFGGKRTLAPMIVKELGKHTQYFEPFCGSMAVLLGKPKSQKETVNDLHCDLINLGRVLQNQDAAEHLYEHLQTLLFSEDILFQAQGHIDKPFPPFKIKAPEDCTSAMMERAYWYFIASWYGRNGTAGTERIDYQLSVRWTKNGGSPTVRWKNAVGSIPAWHERLLNVVILHRDAFDIINNFEDVKETAIYVDSPYHENTRGKKVKNGAGGTYLHEFVHTAPAAMPLFAGDDDEKDQHTLLAEALKKYKRARIVVSHYDCPEIRELYQGWTITEHTRQKHLYSQNGRGARPKTAPEILIINGPSYVGHDQRTVLAET